MGLESGRDQQRGSGAAPEAVREGAAGLRLDVLFTAPGPTAGALRHAFELSRGLQAEVVLTALQVVPQALPPEGSRDQRAALERRCRELVRRACGEAGARARIQIYLCRDRGAALAAALPPGSLVLLGRPRAWHWPAWQRLARRLRRSGHAVLRVGGEGHAHA
jgi:hypothetical protein